MVVAAAFGLQHAKDIAAIAAPPPASRNRACVRSGSSSCVCVCVCVCALCCVAVGAKMISPAVLFPSTAFRSVQVLVSLHAFVRGHQLHRLHVPMVSAVGSVQVNQTVCIRVNLFISGLLIYSLTWPRRRHSPLLLVLWEMF